MAFLASVSATLCRPCRTCLAVSLLLPACGHSPSSQGPQEVGSAAESPAAPPSFDFHAEDVAAGLPFGWKTGESALVTEDSTKQGKTTRIRYRIRLGETADERVHLVQLSDFEILDMEGVDMEDPMLKASMGPALTLMQSVPSFRVGPRGEYLGASEEDIDEMTERVSKQLGQLEKGLAMTPEDFMSSMRDPELRRVLTGMNADAWNAWVGNWVGLELQPGEKHVESLRLPLGSEAVPVEVVTRHEGPSPEAVGQIGLSIRMTLSGPELGSVLAPFLSSMSQKLATPGDGFDQLAPTDWTFTSTAGVQLSPADCRPSSAYYEKRVDAAPREGEGPVSRIERHSYSFSWD